MPVRALFARECVGVVWSTVPGFLVAGRTATRGAASSDAGAGLLWAWRRRTDGGGFLFLFGKVLPICVSYFMVFAPQLPADAAAGLHSFVSASILLTSGERAFTGLQLVGRG